MKKSILDQFASDAINAPAAVTGGGGKKGKSGSGKSGSGKSGSGKSGSGKSGGSKSSKGRSCGCPPPPCK
jgi:hypothetical protein